MRSRKNRVEYILDDADSGDYDALPPPPLYSREQLIEDHLGGLFMAVGLMAIASVAFGLLLLANLVQLARGLELEMAWSTFGMTVAVVCGSYLVAGQAGAFAFFILRPLRNNTFGWMLTGFALAVIAYGTIGLALAVFFDPVGKIFLEDGTAEEAWEILHYLHWLGFVGMAFGAWQWWHRDKLPTP